MDELQACTSYMSDFRNACVLAITETWLDGTTHDNELKLDGLGIPIRMDRDTQAAGKSHGGAAGKRKGKGVYLNSGSDVMVIEGDDVTQAAECGIGRFKPAALGVCANMAAFTGFYSVAALITSTLSFYVNSQVTTLERHFGFSSSQTGLIMAANDVGFLSVVLLVSYLASKVHIPRALGFFAFLFGVSGLVCALPYFVFDKPSPYGADVTSGNVTTVSLVFSGQMCDSINSTSSGCGAKIPQTGLLDDDHPGNEANSGVALMVIVMGMMLQGIAKAPRSSFVSLYMDHNVDKTNTGFYLGIVFTFGILGPGLAFALGGVFSRIYVTLEETDLHFRHPRWIGAWWLGYITFGIVACLWACPLLLFPRQIKGGKPSKRPSVQFDRVSALKMVFQFLKDWLGTMRRLLTSPVYVCVLTSSCFVMFCVAGAQSFTPKYIENQFSLDAWKVNFAMAGMLLAIASTGTLLGGYLSKRLKMDASLSLKCMLVYQVITIVFIAAMMVLKCDQPLIYNSPGPQSSEKTTPSGCHDNCTCDDDDYFPVCGDDGRAFFSPCHAGCQGNKGVEYVNCSCIAGGTAVAGLCDYGCPMVYVHIACYSFSVFFTTMSIVPKFIFFLRTAEDRDKSLAIGLYTFVSSVIGWMLGPICFGKLIDSVCIQWEKSCLGGGACRLYDNDNFRLGFLGLQMATLCCSVLFLIVAITVVKVTRKPEGQENEVGENVEQQEALVMMEEADGKKQGTLCEQDESQKQV